MRKAVAIFLSSTLLAAPVMAQECRIDPEKEYFGAGDIFYDAMSGWMVNESDTRLQPQLDEESLILLSFFSSELANNNQTLSLIVPPKRGIFVPKETFDQAQAFYDKTSTQAEISQSYSALIEQLRSTGAIVPNFLAAAQAEPVTYFKTDHHWSPTMAFAAAQTLWSSLADAGILRLPSDENSFIPEGSVTTKREGSFAKKLNPACDLSIPDEGYTYLNVLKAPTLTGVTDNSLFGDLDADVFDLSLLGSSFSADKTNLRFSDGLQMWLHAPTNNLAISGGKLDTAFEAAVTHPTALEADLIVWEWSPNQIPSDSERIRVAVASSLNQCEKTDQISNMLLTDDDWSDWRTMPATDSVVQVSTDDSLRLDLSVEADFGNRTELFLVEKNPEVSSDDRNNKWLTIISQINRDTPASQPQRFRVRLENFEGTAEGTIKTCGLSGTL